MRFALTCTLSGVMTMLIGSAFAQTAPWETPPEAPATQNDTAAPSATPVSYAPGWLVTLRPRNGASLIDISEDTLARFISPAASFDSTQHIAMLDSWRMYLPAIYDFSGLINITSAGTYSFMIDARSLPDVTMSGTSLLCGLSLRLGEQNLIPLQLVELKKPKDSRESIVEATLTSKDVQLEPGTYPISWVNACRPEEQGTKLERTAFQAYANASDKDMERRTARVSLLMSADKSLPRPISPAMIVHDAALTPKKDAPIMAPALQAGVRAGWKIETFKRAPERDPDLKTLPTVAAAGSGEVASLTTELIVPLSQGADPMPDFVARSNFIATQSGRYTLVVKARSLVGLTNPLGCHLQLSFGTEENRVTDPLIVRMPNSGTSMAVGFNLQSGVYPVELVSRCANLKSHKDPSFTYNFAMLPPGASQLQDLPDGFFVVKD